MNDFIPFFTQQLLTGPVLPATLLVGLLIVYTTLAMIGFIDLGMDAPQLEMDASVEVPDGVALDSVPTGWDFWQGIGAASIHATNFGRVPVIIWAGIFTLAYWTTSYLLWHTVDQHRYVPALLPSVLLSIRNVVIAVAATKALTQPLVKRFVAGPSYEAGGLIGATCEVATLEAAPEYGQGKFRTQAAPLLLNIRTDGPHIARGTEVLITGFDQEKRLYRVTSLPTESSS